MKSGVALFIGFALFVGCSSGGSGSSTGTSGSSVSGMCNAFCDWSTRCAKPEQNCQSECTSDITRNFDKLSGSYTNMFVTCFQSLACSEKDDACIANFGGADPAYPNIPEVTACNEKRTECSQPTPEGDAGSVTQPNTAFSDDYCLSITALNADARAKANACLSQPCAGIRDCLIQAGSFNY